MTNRHFRTTVGLFVSVLLLDGESCSLAQDDRTAKAAATHEVKKMRDEELSEKRTPLQYQVTQ